MPLFQLQRKPRELRRSPRYDVHYRGLIESGDGAQPFNCVISNISSTGAKITTVGTEPISDEFTLVFRRRCRVLRRANGQLAVKFIPS